MARTAANGKKIGVAGQRQLRVGELVRHALSEILARGSLNEPALDGVIVTVPEVRVSNDLKLATCYIMPLGGKDADAVVAALDTHRKFLRGEVSRRIDLKFAVDLKFKVDTSFAEGARIDALLRTDPVVRQDIESAPRDDDASDEE
ncbi:30S ribosome-binding factor RbfA [Kaistia granuli]|uniref:30S ribosome-binding factor RbfA n=1 Tax=Kaistia granuli TaxID=363259 RepID=UPI00035E1145|nr:30S ribosome-binding factor RbfA [Kaistia granuli]